MFMQQTFLAEPEMFEHGNGTCVVWGCECFDAVELHGFKSMFENGRQSFAHEPFAAVLLIEYFVTHFCAEVPEIPCMIAAPSQHFSAVLIEQVKITECFIEG